MSSSLFREYVVLRPSKSGINSSRIQLAGRQMRSINKRNAARASVDSSPFYAVRLQSPFPSFRYRNLRSWLSGDFEPEKQIQCRKIAQPGNFISTAKLFPTWYIPIYDITNMVRCYRYLLIELSICHYGVKCKIFAYNFLITRTTFSLYWLLSHYNDFL